MINRFGNSRICLALILSISILDTQAAAQTTAQAGEQQQPDSSVAGTTQAGTLPTSDSMMLLQQLIQSRPDVLEELKDFLIQRLHQEGSAIDDQSVTDQMLYARLQSDPEFRNAAVQWLVDQGTISPETAKGLMTSVGAASLPSRTQPPEQETSAMEPGVTPEGAVNQPGEVPEGIPNQPGETKSKPTALTREQRFDDSALNPKTILQKNPYPGLPSTRALYTQFPDQPKTLKRFGSDLFRPDMVGLNKFPMDLPAGSDYILGTGDTLALDIWGGVSQRLTRLVDREGRISLPDAGPVLVAGLTLAQARNVIQNKIESQYRDAKVDVSVTRVRNVRIYVVGDVQRPGAYDISSLSTPLNALYAAGGPTPTGSLRVVKHYRGTQLVSEMDLYDLLIGGVVAAIEHLQPGDTILVPPVGPLVAVTGMVRRPAIYELLGDTQLADVLQYGRRSIRLGQSGRNQGRTH